MRIGFIGLGIMGSRMAANFRAKGHELWVYNRTRDRLYRTFVGSDTHARGIVYRQEFKSRKPEKLNINL